MKVILAGGTGFLGQPLVARLAGKGHDVVVLSRGGVSAAPRGSRAVPWHPEGSTGPWAAEIDGADAVVNLSGAGIADKRWSAERKEVLRSSRVLSTRSLAAAVRAAARKPAVFIQGSAVGFYGTAGDEIFDEASPPGDDYLGQMLMAAEAEARPVESLGVRLVIVRAGVVLARDGGALPRLMRSFQFFVGGPVASGRQYLSWVHREDWMALIEWALEQPAVSGAINATAPQPVTNAEFSAALGRALGRPSWLRVPAFALRLLVGEVADLMLVNGQRVVPKRATELGFRFTYPDIDSAMAAAVASR